jgi:hypothetical protein
MALQSTGGTQATILEPNYDPTQVRKGIITDILARDYRNADGTVNNLAATAAGLNPNGVFTPFAQDGTLRNDLLVTASSPNQGFYHAALLKDDGWTFTPDLTVDETPVAQSPWSVRNDVTKRTGEIMFTMRQWMPLADYLRMDLPTINGVPDAGSSGYSLPAPAYAQLCERQIIALGFDGLNQFAITFPRLSQKKLGKTAANKKDPLDTEFTFSVILDPYTGAPYIISNGGTGWSAEGGAPVVGTVASTAQSGLKVQLVFTLSGKDIQNPTFSATKITGGTTTALTLGTPTISNGTVTILGSGLTASAAYTGGTLTVTGDNGATATATIPAYTATSS